MFYVGADVARKRWFAASLNDQGGWEAGLFPGVQELWEQYKDAALILLDIPIGLPDTRERTCDLEARRLLGPRWPSVFLVPCRRAVYARTYQEARQENLMATGKSVSIQTWGITAKIREVDHFLLATPAARPVIREAHPEACFLAFNGGQPMKSPKKRREGVLERQQVLSGTFPGAAEAIGEAFARHRGVAGRDDILDAFSLAAAAYGGRNGLRSVPVEPERDSLGLPMEIVYPG